jgi:hypothetical protein
MPKFLWNKGQYEELHRTGDGNSDITLVFALSFFEESGMICAAILFVCDTPLITRMCIRLIHPRQNLHSETET